MPSPKEKPKGVKTKKSAGKVAARSQPAISAKQAAKLLKDKYVQQLDQHQPEGESIEVQAVDQVEGAGRWAVDELLTHERPRYQDLRAETLKVIQGNSRFSADLLNSLMDETAAQLKELESQMQAAELEVRETVSSAEQVQKEYTQLMNWAELYDNCSLEAKKMIVAQFVKAVRVKRGYELDIEFNVSFEEFQALYLEPEEKAENGSDAREGTSDGRRIPDSVSGVLEETGVLDTVDHDCGKFFSCRHNLTYAVESGLGAADRLGGVSLA